MKIDCLVSSRELSAINVSETVADDVIMGELLISKSSNASVSIENIRFHLKMMHQKCEV